MAFERDFLGDLSSVVTYEPWTGQDLYGNDSFGTLISIPAHVTYRTKIVRGDATNEAVLSGQRHLFAGLDTWDGLVRWTDSLVEFQVQLDGRGGCPIANLLGQLGERDEDTRLVLASGFDRWEAAIRDGLTAMVATGALRPDADADWLAASTLASLQGGLVLTQARRDPRALRRALDGALALIGTYRATG